MSSHDTWSYVLVVAGVLACAAGLLFGVQAWSWGALVAGVLFWLGVAQGQIIFRAMIALSNGRWSAPFQSPAQSGARFVAWGTALLIGLLLAHPLWLPVEDLSPRKTAWLSGRALLLRDGSLAIVLAWLSYRFARRASYTVHRPGLAAGLILLFTLTYSLLAFDLIAIPSEWDSTLFGAYFFIGAILGGMAMTLVLAHVQPIPQKPSPEGWHDFGKLFFGFSSLWAYLLWSQYLTIWFGNLPHETDFVVRRLWEAPWAALSWSAGLCLWAIPFVALLSRRAKRHPGFLTAIAVIVLLGLLLERVVLILPLVVADQRMSPLGVLVAGFVVVALGAAYWLSCSFGTSSRTEQTVLRG